MSERPILFSTPMIQALLAGRKSQTRRIVKLNMAGRIKRGSRNWHVADPAAVAACPYGIANDTLWVRETWRNDFIPHEDGPEYGEGRHVGYLYAADPGEKGPWRPSIFMPRQASRITLRITDVRVERLQEISAADCYAEGIERPAPGAIGSEKCGYDNARNGYRKLWESINGVGSWEANPYVWCVAFERIANSERQAA